MTRRSEQIYGIHSRVIESNDQIIHELEQAEWHSLALRIITIHLCSGLKK